MMSPGSLYPDLSYQSAPLPEDLEKLKYYGDFEGAQTLIARLLKSPIPGVLRRRLEMEAGVLDLLSRDDYPHTFDDAQKIARERLRDYHPEELLKLKEEGRVDWIYVKGQVHFHRRFFESLIASGGEYADRLTGPTSTGDASKKERELIASNIREMKEKGERRAEIRLRASLKIKKAFEEPGRQVRVHLPLPIECPEVSDFKLIKAAPLDVVIAPPDVPQRTACFTTILKADEVFSVEYSFVNHARYVNIDAPAGTTAFAGTPRDKPFQPLFLGEQLPHIRFTPYLRLLLEEILAGEARPLQKARRIYDFITTQVMYSYMREYAAIENISQYAAINLKGDCGVQAILFITLCRIAGIPAAWQSGLGVTGYKAGCHDWARFYVEPWGWLFADPSYGGSAWRRGETGRWNYYFGNLDVFRMPANSAILADFVPAKKHPRADPVDNQCGEAEYEDRGLPAYALETKQEVVSFSF